MKKIQFINDQEPDLSADTLNELQKNIEDGKADSLLFENNLLQLTANGQPLGSSVLIKVGSNDVFIGKEENAPEEAKILIDESLIAVPTNLIVSSLDNNEEDKAPSVKAINHILEPLTTYSTSEKIVGKYLDTSLYKKTIVLDSLIDCVKGSWTNIYDVSLLDIDKLVDIKVIANNGCSWSGYITRINNNCLELQNNMTTWAVKEFTIYYTKNEVIQNEI